MIWTLAIAAGGLVGLVLGLIGGGGSIFAVPLLIYLVGVPSMHVAIGTSAVAVALSAATNLLMHARRGNVRWRSAALFALTGIVGAWVGARLGKMTDGRRLLVLFGLVMLAVGALTFSRHGAAGRTTGRIKPGPERASAPRLLGTGLATGVASGFFGIGGGFLVVPSLLYATDMPMIAAVGSSLVAVTAFGLVTALSYATSGLVDWGLAAAFIAGGLLGGLGGTRLAFILAARRRALAVAFGTVVIAVGGYIALSGLEALWPKR